MHHRHYSNLLYAVVAAATILFGNNTIAAVPVGLTQAPGFAAVPNAAAKGGTFAIGHGGKIDCGLYDVFNNPNYTVNFTCGTNIMWSTDGNTTTYVGNGVTQAKGDSSNALATDQFVANAIASLSGGSGGGGGSYTGGSSVATVTASVTILIPTATRTLLAYQIAGSATDYGCFIWALPSNVPVFNPTNSGASTSCGLAGSFLDHGQTTYVGSPPPAGYVLFGKYVGTAPTDTFNVTASW